jgi:Ca-activated chloride channel family protein
MRRPGIVVAGLCAWLLVAAIPAGQTTPQAPATGVIQGVVVDAASAPLPGVTVALDRAGAPEAARVTRVTDPQGRFRFENVTAGAYRLTAQLAGFKTLVFPNINVAPGSPLAPVRLTMAVGDISETVTVMNVTLDGVAPGAAALMPMNPQFRAGAGLAGRTGGAGQGQVSDSFFVMPGLRHNTEAYAYIESNPFRLTKTEPLSTFAADVDTASYTNVRRFLSGGALPPIDAVRVEELINYFHYSYADPDAGRPVSITTDVGNAPWAPDHKLVLVGLKARPIDDRGVKGRNIVLLIDVSGSMAPPNKLPLLQTGLRMFVDSLRDDDRVAIVVYASATGLVLPSTPASHRQRIHDAIANLRAGGSTAGAAGIQLAYQTARAGFIPGGINRVILATDGDFNVGVSSDSELVRLIEKERESGIFLSVLGVGTGNIKDSKMEGLADKGNGHYAYLDSLQEARRVLVREGGATLETVAKDVKFQVEFNPATVAAWKLIGYENRLLPHEAFNDDTKDGGELGAGHTVTVLYEVVPVGAPLPEDLLTADGASLVDPLVYQTEREPATNGSRDLLMVKVRYKLPDEDTSTLMTRPVADGRSGQTLTFAAAVAEFGMLLRDKEAPDARWDGLLGRLKTLPVTVTDAADRRSFEELVELAAGLSRMKN